MENKILVSVLMITYGHEKYIKQAIEGVLMQKGNFDLQFIISNDCSPDNTDKIIQNLFKLYPNTSLIEYINNEKNLGIMPNFLKAHSRCKGKYIAICEGDDYWIDPLKLQKQIDFFEDNTRLGLVYTGLKSYNEDLKIFSENILNYVSDRNLIIPSLLITKYIEFCTVMINAKLLSDVLQILKPELLNDAIIGDTRIILECAYKSEIGFISEVTTVYRIVQGSASHPLSIKRTLATVKDTYNCRKFFINRNFLDKRMLGVALCNYNKGLIGKSYEEKKYLNVLLLLSNLNIKDYFSYCSFKTFKEKTNLKIISKLILSIFGISVLRQAIKPQ